MAKTRSILLLAAALALVVPVNRLLAADKPADRGASGGPRAPATKSFVYKKTKQAGLELIVHYPPGWRKSDKRPAIVFFFGGGFVYGDNSQFAVQAAYFAGRGMVAARADYRVKSRHGVEPDACIEDGKSAVRWLRQNAAMLGIDPNRIVASGSSSGGCIAACSACPGLDAAGEDARVSSQPNATILFYPWLPSISEQSKWKIVPALHLAKSSPPVLILIGTKDGGLKRVEEFMAKSKAAGHRAELFLAEGAGHGFTNAPLWRARALCRADEFLASLGYLEGKPTIEKP